MRTNEECVEFFRESFLNIFPCECWVAGGAIRSFLLDEKIVDIDVYFPDEQSFAQACVALFDLHAEITYNNDNVTGFVFKLYRIELVKHFFPSPEATVANFDFTVCSVAVDKERVYKHPDFEVDAENKELRLNNLPQPLSTMYRLQKYARKGYRAYPPTIYKIAQAIQQIDLADFDIKKTLYVEEQNEIENS